MSPHSVDIMEDPCPSPPQTLYPPVYSSNGQQHQTSDSETVPQLVNGTSSAVSQPSQQHNGVDAPVASVRKSQYVLPTNGDEVHDLVCVGFGPASCAIAIALHDALESGNMAKQPKVLFLEKQPQFAWHAGMLLPGAKMQISFIKDLASLRNPRSHFTFLNYLHQHDRLVDFTNLSTFLPARIEYEDYLRWCARHFDDVVLYNSEVLSVTPVPQEAGAAELFTVTSRNGRTGAINSYKTRNVIVAVGGQASIPKMLPTNNPRVIHSSQYAQRVPQLLSNSSAPYRVAVIGAGQSAAEIFNNVQNLYPNSKTYLIMRSEWLKPSDDSPFVNSIFNPEFVDHLFPKSSTYRKYVLDDARATNYGVVRLELIEHLFEKMYHQKRTLGVNEKKWPHRILAGRQIVKIDEQDNGLRVKVSLLPVGAEQDGPLLEEEDLDVDLVICATGYQRTAHVDMLKDAWHLLPEAPSENGAAPTVRKDRWLVETANGGKTQGTSTRVLEVGRNYGVRFAPGAVSPGSGVWLQGCCEATHGLSDTLLSVLSTRSGEMIDSIFGAGSRR